MDGLLLSLIQPLVQLAIVTTMVSVGMQVTGEQVVSAVSRTSLMAKALLANLVLMPLVSYLLVQVLDVPQGIALGLLLVAVAPGAPLIPKMAEIAKADLPFAIGLMVVLAVVSIVTAPVTAGIILPLDDSIQFHVPTVIRSLIIYQLIPLLIGLGVRRLLPGVQAVLVRPSIWLANVVLILVIALIVWRDFQTLITLPWTAVAATLLFIASALIAGWLLGGPYRQTRRALSLGTSAQSNGLALLIASTNFPDTAAVIAIVAFGLLNIVINFLIALYWGRRG